MIFFGALNLAVIFAWRTSVRCRMSDSQWLMIFFFYFLGFWSGFEFWTRAVKALGWLI